MANLTSAFPLHALNITPYASFNGSHLDPLEFQHSFATFTTFTTTPTTANGEIQGHSSTSTSDSLQCPTFTREDSEFKVAFSFWVEGVIQVILAVFGILGNILSCFVLTRKEMRNSFNLLLVTLATFDTCYLIGAILESLRKSFHSASDVHILMFPYFLYPLYQTSMAGSIFMTVAIAFERYSAVHLPVNYSQSLNDAHAMKRRLLKYIIPVCILSFLLNVPKFLEAEIKYQKVALVPPSLSTNGPSETFFDGVESTSTDFLTNGSSTDTTAFYMKPVLSITPLRMHPLYSNYNNWSRLFVLGIIPFALLVFFNVKIYSAIKARKKRKQQRLAASTIATAHPAIPASACPSAQARESSSPPRVQHLHVESGEKPKERLIIECTPLEIGTDNASSVENESQLFGERSSQNGKSNGLSRGLRKSNCSLRKARMERRKSEDEKASHKVHVSPSPSLVLRPHQASNDKPPLAVSENIQEFDALDEMPIKRELKIVSDTSNSDSGPKVKNKGFYARIRALNAFMPQSTRSSSQRRSEDNLAAIFMGIILIFLICHFPRVMMNIHELAIIHRSASCAEADRPQFSLWSLIMISVSHVFLVLNSATNMIVYCLLSLKFRSECVKILSSLWIRK